MWKYRPDIHDCGFIWYVHTEGAWHTQLRCPDTLCQHAYEVVMLSDDLVFYVCTYICNVYLIYFFQLSFPYLDWLNWLAFRKTPKNIKLTPLPPLSCLPSHPSSPTKVERSSRKILSRHSSGPPATRHPPLTPPPPMKFISLIHRLYASPSASARRSGSGSSSGSSSLGSLCSLNSRRESRSQA